MPERATTFMMGVMVTSILLSLTSCESRVARTQAVVIVDADSEIAAMAPYLRLEVRGFAGRDPTDTGSVRLDRVVRPGTDGIAAYPIRLVLGPLDSDATRVWEIRATAQASPNSEDPQELVTARAISGYVSQKAVTLRLRLEQCCIGVECEANQTCRACMCQDAFIDPNTLLDADASVPMPDASLDASLDAAPDATPDASGGCRDASLIETGTCALSFDNDDGGLRVQHPPARADSGIAVGPGQWIDYLFTVDEGPTEIEDLDLVLSFGTSHSESMTFRLFAPGVSSSIASNGVTLFRQHPIDGSPCSTTGGITGLRFDDEATRPLNEWCPSSTGDFRPDEPLCAFDGFNATGVWTLRASAVEGPPESEFGGQLIRADLRFRGPGCP